MEFFIIELVSISRTGIRHFLLLTCKKNRSHYRDYLEVCMCTFPVSSSLHPRDKFRGLMKAVTRRVIPSLFWSRESLIDDVTGPQHRTNKRLWSSCFTCAPAHPPILSEHRLTERRQHTCSLWLKHI